MRILYFAWVREQIGTGHEDVDPPADVRDVDGLITWLAMQSPAHAAALGNRDRLRAAIDQRFVSLDNPIAGSSEIAIFPPVTGG